MRHAYQAVLRKMGSSLVDVIVAKAADADGLLETLWPGPSQAARRLRKGVSEFCQDYLAQTLLLRGPIGSGKSTLARVLALLRYVNPMSLEERHNILRFIRFDGPMRIDKLYLQWYEELGLTGLSESIADSQLFGSVKGAFTDATTRAEFSSSRLPGI